MIMITLGDGHAEVVMTWILILAISHALEFAIAHLKLSYLGIFCYFNFSLLTDIGRPISNQSAK